MGCDVWQSTEISVAQHFCHNFSQIEGLHMRSFWHRRGWACLLVVLVRSREERRVKKGRGGEYLRYMPFDCMFDGLGVLMVSS